MAEEAPITGPGQLGINLLIPASRKLIEAGNVYYRTQDKQAAHDLYLGAVSQLAGVMTAQIGNAASLDILRMCATVIERTRMSDELRHGARYKLAPVQVVPLPQMPHQTAADKRRARLPLRHA